MYELTRGGTAFFPVGCWVVAERVLVSRGTPVGGRQRIVLPVWSPEESHYIEAGKPGAGGVMVDFSPDNKLSEAPLLVDFEGGKLSYRGVEAEVPIDVLLLSSDGKLLGRNSQADAADLARRDREEGWRDWLKSGKPPR